MFTSWPWKPWGKSRDRWHLTTPLLTCLDLELGCPRGLMPQLSRVVGPPPAGALEGPPRVLFDTAFQGVPAWCAWKALRPRGAQVQACRPRGGLWVDVCGFCQPSVQALSRGNGTYNLFCGWPCDHGALLWRQPRPGRLTSPPGIWVLSRDTHTENNRSWFIQSRVTKEGNQCLSTFLGPLAAWVLILPEAWLFTFHSVVWTNSYSSSKCPHPSPKLALKPTSITGNQKPPKGISSNPCNNLICHYYPYFNVR